MNEMEILKKVQDLLHRKEVITKDIESIETDQYSEVAEIVLKKPPYFQSRSIEFYNQRRFYRNVKYLVLAELNESLDRTNAEINRLIEFKGVDE